MDEELVDALDEDVMLEDPEDAPPQFGMDVDMLISMGVAPADACDFVRKRMCAAIPATNFIEVYGRGGLSDEAKNTGLNLKGLGALDLATEKTDGTH